MKRNNLSFTYSHTAEGDVEATHIWELDNLGNYHLIGSIQGITPTDIEQYTDEELEELLNENFIIPNYS